MQIHERVMIVQRAELDLREFFGQLVKKHDLTWGEIAMILGGTLQAYAKYQIREERHPDDPDRPGGLA
jgi:hypothetical protein